MFKTPKSRLYLLRIVYAMSMLCLISCAIDNIVHGKGINLMILFLILFGTWGFIALNKRLRDRL